MTTPNNIPSAAKLAKLLAEMEQRAETEITRLFGTIGSGWSRKRELNEFIESMVSRREALHIKAEFTPEVVSTCTQILTFGMAALAAIIAFWQQVAQLPDLWRKWAVVGTGAAANLTLLALLVLFWFFVQARTRYPFLFLKRLGNAAPFFYYQTLNRQTPFRPFGSNRWIVVANKHYLDDLTKFGAMLVEEHKDPMIRARHELQQYYLLIVYQGYLDQYEMQLEHVFLGGLVWVATATFGVFLVTFF